MIDYNEIFPDMGYFICRHCTPSWFIGESEIHFIDLTYIFDGSASYTIDGHTYNVEKGDLLCIPKKSRRYATSDSEHLMKNYAANFQLLSLNGGEAMLPFPVVSKIGIRPDLLDLYEKLTIEWLQKKPGYKLKVHAIFLTILHYYFSLLHYQGSLQLLDPRIQKATKFIIKNFAEQIDVSDLAELTRLNPVYFGNLFKKNTGVSVKEYINRTRINYAENMLSSGEFTVYETSMKCGFKDVFYFSKVFKNIKGYSPSKIIVPHL